MMFGCSEDLSDNESEEKPSVAICGGSICILTGLTPLSVLGTNTGFTSVVIKYISEAVRYSREHNNTQ